jgi:trimeric autotransporter adhesin
MKRGLNHKNSLPDPEFGRESSESARAIHYVVQKDTLMTYVSALIAQADLRKLRGSTIERKQMSTKTIYKRIALVAVASLGAGVLSVAPASAAAVTGSAVIGPVRASFIGTTQDVVDAAAVTITATGAETNAVAATGGAAATPLLNTVALTTAPTAAAVLTIAQANVTDGASASLAVTASGSGAVTLANSRTLTAASTAALITTAQAISGITFKVDTAGTYAGTITTAQVGGGNTLTTPFTFTTRGAPTSFDFTTTTAGQTSSAVSGAISVTVTLRDAANNITQGSTVDTIALTAAISAGGTVGTFANPGSGAGIVRATDLADGTSAVVYTNSVTPASTSTLTATPRGTLGTLAAKTLTVTTVSASTGVPTATVAVSNTTIKASTSTSVLNKYTVSRNQTSVTFNVTGLTPNAAFTYDLIASAGTFTTVNGAAYTSDADLVGVSSATGTFSVVVVADTPASQTITLDLNTDATADVTGQVDADFTYAAAAYAVTVTTPAATPLFRTSSAITYTGKVADQFGNALGGASILATGTPTPATTPSTITATAVTAADGTYTVTLPAVAATTTSLSTVVSATSAASISPASANVAYFTATGIAATLVLTDSDSDALTLTTDDKSTRTIVLGEVANNNVNISDMSQAGAANAANWVSITPQTTLPASVGYSVTATNGIRLFANGATMTGALGLANTAAITGTGGQEFFAVPTKVGAGVITVVSGGLTKTFTLTGVLPTTPKANLVTLTAGTVAGSYTVTATDLFGNGVAADVAISVAGPGAFGNGFKNLTVTTAAVTGQNTFSIVSDGSAPTVVTASIAGAGNYFAITATHVTTYGLTAASAAATSTLAGKGSDATGTTLASLTTLINSLIAKINALNRLVIKIQKKVRA